MMHRLSGRSLRLVLVAATALLIAAAGASTALSTRVGIGYMPTSTMQGIIEERGFTNHRTQHFNVDTAMCLGLRRGGAQGYSFHLFKCSLVLADQSRFTISTIAQSATTFSVTACRIDYSTSGLEQNSLDWGGSHDCLNQKVAGQSTASAGAGRPSGYLYMTPAKMQIGIETYGFRLIRHWAVDTASCIGLGRYGVNAGNQFHGFKCSVISADQSSWTLWLVTTSTGYSVQQYTINHFSNGLVQNCLQYGGTLQFCLKQTS